MGEKNKDAKGYSSLDGRFAADVKKQRLLARVYPFLRVYLASGESWRAADWLNRFLRDRPGEASLEETLAHLARIFEKFRRNVYDEEAYAAGFEHRFPLGDRDYKPEK